MGAPGRPRCRTGVVRSLACECSFKVRKDTMSCSGSGCGAVDKVGISGLACRARPTTIQAISIANIGPRETRKMVQVRALANHVRRTLSLRGGDGALPDFV